MDGTNTKVSFIPKGSLVREEPFLERRRPQSAIGLLAGVAFVLAVGSFVGLYYYNNKLNTVILEKTEEINRIRQEFKDVPEVAQARVFRARADLARELLNSHKVVSPVFVFLSDNTTESVLYNNFAFKNVPSGATLELSGEAQNYASLAFQADVFSGRTKELSKFSVDNIALTKFGTVTFSIAMVFKPDYLLYTKNIGDYDVTMTNNEEIVETPTSDEGTVAPVAPAVIVPQDATVATSSLSLTPNGSLPSDWTSAPAGGEATATSTTTGNIEGASALRKLWLRFKFW